MEEHRAKYLLMIGAASSVSGAALIGAAPAVGIGLLILGACLCLIGLAQALNKK